MFGNIPKDGKGVQVQPVLSVHQVIHVILIPQFQLYIKITK